MRNLRVYGILLVIVFAFTLCVSAQKKQEELKTNHTQSNIKGKDLIEVKLSKTINESKKIRIGATLNYEELNTKKEGLYLKHFKYLTPANAAKQTRIHPKPNEWNWTQINDFIR